MALESLTKKIYSEKTDVWSWGVTAWECLTRQTPYPDLDNVNTIAAVLRYRIHFMRVIVSGTRLPIPTNCHPKLGVLLKSCWQDDPNKRPTFAQIVSELSQIQM